MAGASLEDSAGTAGISVLVKLSSLLASMMHCTACFLHLSLTAPSLFPSPAALLKPPLTCSVLPRALPFGLRHSLYTELDLLPYFSPHSALLASAALSSSGLLIHHAGCRPPEYVSQRPFCPRPPRRAQLSEKRVVFQRVRAQDPPRLMGYELWMSHLPVPMLQNQRGCPCLPSLSWPL